MSQSRFDPRVDPAARRASGGAKWNLFPADVIPAWVAETDFEPLPEILDAIHRVADSRNLGYTLGEERLRQACADWMLRRHDWEIQPDLIISLTDVMQGVQLAVTAFTEPGDGVVVTTPIYYPFLQVAPSAGRRQVDWPMKRGEDGWHFDTDDLERILIADPGIRVILLSHPSNPTGRLSDPVTMDRIVELAAAHGAMIVSDEIHCDLTYPGKVFRSMLRATGSADRVVVSTSAAKTFAMSGLRSSVLVCGDEAVKRQIGAAHPRMLLGQINRTGADACVAAWENGDAWLDGLLGHLTAMRTKLIQRLGSEAPAVRFHPPDATFLAWLDVEACDLGDTPADKLLSLAKVALEDGAKYGAAGLNHVRINFATSEELLDEILDRLIPHLQS